ncbi:MAG: sugar porter family MFS transporter [Cyclobacteriaceae bacterium]
MRNAFIYASIVAMGGLIFGLDAALISGTVGFITKEFDLTAIQQGMAVGAPAFGVLIALLFAGFLSNRFGRKRTIQLIAALYVISAVGSALATSYWMLVAARFLGGLAFTSISLAAMYIGEIAPSKLRGKLVSMIQILIVVGLSGAYYINNYILKAVKAGAEWAVTYGVDDNVWRWMLGSEILPALIWFVLLIFIPRSPSWLMFKGREEEARASLRKLIPEDQIDHHIKEMKKSLEKSDQSHSLGAQFKEMMSQPMRVILIVAVTIAIAQQATGINAILFYAPTVFEQLGMGTDAAFTQTTWIGLTSVVFTLLSLLLVDKLGRRPLIIWGMVWIIASLGLAAFGFSQARYTLTEDDLTELSDVVNSERLAPMIGTEYENDIAFKNELIAVLGETDARNHSSVLLQKAATMNASLILFSILSIIAAFHFSVGPVMWVLFSEIFPISIRGIAIPVVTFITSFVSWLVQQFFPWQLANMGGTSIFLFYAGSVFLGLVILYKYLIETKGLSIEEIQAKLAIK